jgi:HSP20 family protein
MARADKKLIRNDTGMHRQMERLLNAALHQLDGSSYAADPAWRPPADVFETEDGFHVRIEIAGFELEDLHVTFENGQLTVKGSRQEEAAGGRVVCRQMEIPYGRFQRTFLLSRDIDAARIVAHYADGFLTIGLPRSAAAERRPIRIDVE